jgi:hypothetical protein
MIYASKWSVVKTGVFVPFLGRFGDGSCLSNPNVDTRAVKKEANTNLS